MSKQLSRRNLFQASGAFVLGSALAACESGERKSTSAENRPLPKLCLGIGSNADEKQMRRYVQIGINHVLMGGPRIPWKEEEIRSRMDRSRAGGLEIVNMMIGGFPNTIYGRSGRDEEIEKVIESIRVAGKVGLPVIEYNFYA